METNEKIASRIECHNDLCLSKGNCDKYKGPPPEDEVIKAYRFRRETCRLYYPKKTVGTNKMKGFKY